jgi:hypothetical protein
MLYIGAVVVGYFYQLPHGAFFSKQSGNDTQFIPFEIDVKRSSKGVIAQNSFASANKSGVISAFPREHFVH